MVKKIISKKPAKKELSKKKAIFVSEYLLDFNGTRAAKAAGYSVKTAYAIAFELLRKPEIVIAISERVDSIIEKNDIKIAGVIKDLHEVKERCMTAKEVMEFNYDTKRLEPNGKWQFDSKGALKAIELIGKYLSMWNISLDLGKAEIKILIDSDDAKL